MSTLKSLSVTQRSEHPEFSPGKADGLLWLHSAWFRGMRRPLGGSTPMTGTIMLLTRGTQELVWGEEHLFKLRKLGKVLPWVQVQILHLLQEVTLPRYSFSAGENFKLVVVFRSVYREFMRSPLSSVAVVICHSQLIQQKAINTFQGNFLVGHSYIMYPDLSWTTWKYYQQSQWEAWVI